MQEAAPGSSQLELNRDQALRLQRLMPNFGEVVIVDEESVGLIRDVINATLLGPNSQLSPEDQDYLKNYVYPVIGRCLVFPKNPLPIVERQRRFADIIKAAVTAEVDKVLTPSVSEAEICRLQEHAVSAILGSTGL